MIYLFHRIKNLHTMKTFIKSSILLLAIVFTVIRANAQQVTMAVDSMFGFPDSAICCSPQYNFTIDVKNYSSIQFGGILNIRYRTGNMNITDSALSFSGNGLSDTILPYGTTTFTITNFSFDTLTSGFRTGGNVVVVWPVCESGTSVFVTDSFHTSVFIESGTGIVEPRTLNSKLKIFPNPANDKIFVMNPLPEKSIEYVRIIDILGVERYSSETLYSFINTSLLKEGVYFIEVKNKNEQPVVSKFIISR